MRKGERIREGVREGERMRKGERIREGVREGDGGSEGGETVLNGWAEVGFGICGMPPPPRSGLYINPFFILSRSLLGGGKNPPCL